MGPIAVEVCVSCLVIVQGTSPSGVCVQYDKVGKLTRDFEPYKNLWNTAADWMRWHDSWMNDALVNIDPEILA